MKILIFSTDLLPQKGSASSGTALRTFGLAEGLRSKGHSITISEPASAIQAFETQNKDNTSELSKITSSRKSLSFHPGNQADLISEINPDLIIFGHWPAYQLSSRPKQKTIIDLAGPHILERHYQESPQQKEAILAKAEILASADNLIVSGKRQAEYFKAYLARTGKDSLAEKFIEIPMPLSPELPEKKYSKSESYPAFFFGGVFLPWQDPSLSLKHVSEYIKLKENGILRLIGGSHPHYKVKTGIYEELFKELKENPQVKHSGMLPLDEFYKELSKADVAIDLMKKNVERELALTIRTTTYLWSGLPVIYNNYSDLSDLITKYDAGWCLAYDDKNALFSILGSVYKKPELLEKKSKNAQKLAREVFSWSHAANKIEKAIKSEDETLKTDVFIRTPDSAKLNLSKSEKLRQYFISRKSGLRQVAVLLKSDETLNSSSEIKIEVRRQVSISDNFQTNEKEDKFETAYCNNFTIEKPFLESWLTLELKPEKDSKGRWYEVILSSSSKNSLVKPWLFHASVYPLGNLYMGEKKLYNSNLCIRTYFS